MTHRCLDRLPRFVIGLAALWLAGCQLAAPAADAQATQAMQSAMGTVTALRTSQADETLQGGAGGQQAVLSPTLAGPAATPPSEQGTPAAQEATPSAPGSANAVRTQYSLAVQLKFARHTFSVSERVTYTNQTGEALPDLMFDVEANREVGVFSLTKLAWEDGSPVSGYTLDKASLSLPLPQPLQPGGTVSVQLEYSIHLPVIPADEDSYRPIPFGYSDGQMNLVDWYPYLPVYQPGTGWAVHDAWYFGEHQDFEAADYQVDLQVLDAVPELTIAASAPAETQGDHRIYRLEAARSFAFSMSTNYVTETVTAGEVTLTGYAFPWDKTAGKLALQNAAEAVELYSRLFGPYPYQSLSVVEADFMDGMEYDGLFFLSRGFYNLYDGTPRGYLTAISVHETAHQWWYGLVGDDQANEPWLDEALATYCERLYYENVHPDALDWWWGTRINFYEPTGKINQTIYDYPGYIPYRNAVYLNGALFLEDLRKEIGDEAFFAFLKDFATQFAHRQATGADFFQVLSQHTSKDLNGLKTKYFADSTG